MRSTALIVETSCQQFSLLKQALHSFDNCLQAVHTFDSVCKMSTTLTAKTTLFHVVDSIDCCYSCYKLWIALTAVKSFWQLLQAVRSSHTQLTALIAETSYQQFSLLKQALDSFDNRLQVHTFDSFFSKNSQIHHKHIHHKKIMEKSRLCPQGSALFPHIFYPFHFSSAIEYLKPILHLGPIKLSSSKISAVSSICPFFPLGMHHKNQFFNHFSGKSCPFFSEWCVSYLLSRPYPGVAYTGGGPHLKARGDWPLCAKCAAPGPQRGQNQQTVKG